MDFHLEFDSGVSAFTFRSLSPSPSRMRVHFPPSFIPLYRRTISPMLTTPCRHVASRFHSEPRQELLFCPTAPMAQPSLPLPQLPCYNSTYSSVSRWRGQWRARWTYGDIHSRSRDCGYRDRSILGSVECRASSRPMIPPQILHMCCFQVRQRAHFPESLR